jgi:hypothetical protein
MKITPLSFLIPCVLLGAACGSPTGPSDPDAFVHTVSFGFCDPRAYCSSRLELFPRQAVMTFESRTLGAVVQRRALDGTLWTRAQEALDADALRALPDVVGCPDCADGGAESLQVTFGDGRSAAVTFEYGDDVQGIEEVVGVLRELRQSFTPPPPVDVP